MGNLFAGVGAEENSQQAKGKGEEGGGGGAASSVLTWEPIRDQSSSSTPTDSTYEESAPSPGDDTKPHNQTTQENSVCTGHDSTIHVAPSWYLVSK